MNKRPTNKKYTLEEVRKLLSEDGFELLSNVYENTFTKLEIRCPHDHIYTTTRNSWRGGRRCPICYKENNHGDKTSAWKGGVVERNIPLYDTYHKKISFCEETRRCPEEERLLQVKCKKCNNWFTPTRYQVEGRVLALYRLQDGRAIEHNFYCSNECKLICPIYKKVKHYDGKLPKERKPYTSQELREWSVEVRQRANFKCEICGNPATESHHIIPKIVNAFSALDPDNGISVCKACHHEFLHTDECTTTKLLKNFCGSK
jgi:hypothetical protein